MIWGWIVFVYARSWFLPWLSRQGHRIKNSQKAIRTNCLIQIMPRLITHITPVNTRVAFYEISADDDPVEILFLLDRVPNCACSTFAQSPHFTSGNIISRRLLTWLSNRLYDNWLSNYCTILLSIKKHMILYWFAVWLGGTTEWGNMPLMALKIGVVYYMFIIYLHNDVVMPKLAWNASFV